MPPLREKNARQRPTLPPGYPGSTIGAGGLNFRVRKGNGCLPSAIVTEPADYTEGGIRVRGAKEVLAGCSPTGAEALDLPRLRLWNVVRRPPPPPPGLAAR